MGQGCPQAGGTGADGAAEPWPQVPWEWRHLQGLLVSVLVKVGFVIDFVQDFFLSSTKLFSAQLLI